MGRVIYGAIIGLALVVALEHHPPPVGAVIATLLGTAVAVGLAELYSDVIGTEVRTRRRISPEDFARLLEDVTAPWRLGSPFRSSSSSSRPSARWSSTMCSRSRNGPGWA